MLELVNEAAEKRDLQAHTRDERADRRDHEAVTRDTLGIGTDTDAAQRDEAASRRDDLARDRDLAWRSWLAAHAATGFVALTPAAIIAAANTASLLAAEDRAAARTDRVAAAFDRSSALADRMLGARRRTDSGGDRRDSSEDRFMSENDRHEAAIDGLSGAYSREAGLVELKRDLARARETNTPLSVVYLDIENLDTGDPDDDLLPADRNLATVVKILRSELKSYHIIVRMGREKLLCVLSGADLAAAESTFADILSKLDTPSTPWPIRTGFAQPRDSDHAVNLVSRAKDATRTAG